MPLSALIPLLFAASLAAGFFGSLTGLGGGVVLIPLLVFFFHVDLPYAIGASLVAVIATSCGAAAAFMREGFTNIRVGMLLEVATVSGALVGASIAKVLPKDVIGTLFGCVMIYSAIMAARPPKARVADESPDPLAQRLRLDSTYPTKEGLVAYHVRQVPGGFGLMFLAGVLSALVGIGSGVIKVVAMDRMMRLPFKVSTTTSNFMIGVTAAASAGVYLHRGQISPELCGPVALGALGGSLIGARVLPKIKTKWLRVTFAVLVGAGGAQMIQRSLSGSL